MYYSVSRSQFRAWNGGVGDRQNQFDETATNNNGFPRGDPVWQAVFAPVALSSDPVAPMLFGGTAGLLFVGMESDLTEKWRIETDSPVSSEARVSPDDQFVYFAEQNGDVHSVNTNTGSVRWSQTLGGNPIFSNFAQSASGKFLFLVDRSGIIHAWQVADPPSPPPTESPSALPTAGPTGTPTSPSASPTEDPDSRPSASPTAQSTPKPTSGPTDPNPTGSPTVATPVPTMSPTRPGETRSPSSLPSFSSSPTFSAASTKAGVSLSVLAVLLTVLLF